MKKYVKNEVTIMQQLDNPHILRIWDFFEDKSYLYLILEYCNGGTLNEYIFNKNPGVQ